MTKDFDPQEARQATRSSFNRAVKEGLITDAVMDSFGDGYGEPYNPNRKAYGTFDGRKVWAWVSGGHPQAEVGWVLGQSLPDTSNPTTAPVVEGALQSVARKYASFICLATNEAGHDQVAQCLREMADRLDHLEAREKAGRELVQEIQRVFYEQAPSYETDIGPVVAAYGRDILTHLDGGSTND